MHALPGCVPLPWPCVVEAKAEMPQRSKAPTGDDCTAGDLDFFFDWTCCHALRDES